MAFKNPNLHLFALCTHLEQSPALRTQMIEAVGQVTDWTDIPFQAEKHGMAPLLNHHLNLAGIRIPNNVRRNLTALALRHRLINQVRSRVLANLVSTFQQANLPFLILKGAALSHMLYPSPDLRPMKDIDILIRKADIQAAVTLLQKIGFHYDAQVKNIQAKHHLPEFTRQEEGFTLNVELHHHLLMDTAARPWGQMEDLNYPMLQFTLPDGVQAPAMSPTDMLYHLCRHSFFDNHALEPLCMIWVADILNLAEKYVHDIDWAVIQQDYPLVLHTLAALHPIRPLHAAIMQSAPIQLQALPDQPIQPYLGWPAYPLSGLKKSKVAQWLRETFFPSAWWLHLRYGDKQATPLWYDWVKHGILLSKEAFVRTLKRFK